MAAYRWVYDSLHLQIDCQELGSALEPYTRQFSMGYLYPFLSQKRHKIYAQFLLKSNRKSYALYRMVTLPMTLSDSYRP